MSDDLAKKLVPFTRRRFLIGAIGLGVVGAGAAIALRPKVGLTIPAGIVHLTAFECALFTQLIPLFLPTDGTALFPPKDVPILKNIDEIFGTLHPQLRDDLGKGLQLFDYGAVVVGFNWTRFINLEPDAARTYCEKWQSGGAVQRAIFSALRQFLYVSYWRDPRTWKAVEYDGPVSARNNLPRLGVTPLPEA
jgi:hypothetical protein